jgi:hypothetical protein
LTNRSEEEKVQGNTWMIDQKIHFERNSVPFMAVGTRDEGRMNMKRHSDILGFAINILLHLGMLRNYLIYSVNWKRSKKRLNLLSGSPNIREMIYFWGSEVLHLDKNNYLSRFYDDLNLEGMIIDESNESLWIP